jgi:hypothetical protein
MALGALGGAKRASNPRKYEFARLAGLASAVARRNKNRQSLPVTVSQNETGVSHFEQSAGLEEFRCDKWLLLKTLVSKNNTDTLPRCPVVYGLFDPRDETLRYIGATGNPSARKRKHLKMTDDHKCLQAWFQALKRLGLEPLFRVISIETWRTVYSAEQSAIKVFSDCVLN